MPAALVSNEQVVEAYQRTGSVWKAAKVLGICGQSVHERLVRYGHKLPGGKWTEDEYAELKSLAGTCTIGEVARRLGRPYGSVAEKLSSLGISGRVRASNKKVSLRGTGLTKPAVAAIVKDLENFSGVLTEFCRQRGQSVDMVVKAIQKYEPAFWARYSANASNLSAKECEYCGGTFYPMNTKQRTCTRKCQAHARADRQYFNGRRKETIGLAEGVCQLCEQPRKSLSSHHAWGKEHDEQADFLVAVCQGCHKLVELLASRKNARDAGFYERLIVFALLRKNGANRPAGFHVLVDIDELTQEELESGSW